MCIPMLSLMVTRQSLVNPLTCLRSMLDKRGLLAANMSYVKSNPTDFATQIRDRISDDFSTASLWKGERHV